MAEYSVGGGGLSIESGANLVFLENEHISYVQKISKDTSSFEFAVTQHLRMSGVYWGYSKTHFILRLNDRNF